MTTMAEPEYDQATRDLLRAYDQVPLCPVCKGPADVCQDPALGESWEVPDPIRCHRTTALAERQAVVDPEDSPNPEALIWSTHLRRPRAVD